MTWVLQIVFFLHFCHGHYCTLTFYSWPFLFSVHCYDMAKRQKTYTVYLLYNKNYIYLFNNK